MSWRFSSVEAVITFEARQFNKEHPMSRSNMLPMLRTVALIAVTLAAHSAVNSDPSTGLALHPGLSSPQEVDSPICHSMSKMNLYYPSREATMAEYLSWYKEKLSSYKFVSSSWSNRTHNAFYSPDGTKLVSITGKPQGDGVYTVNYVAITPALKSSEIGKFSPSNPECK
jgi:hypothetical protein